MTDTERCCPVPAPFSGLPCVKTAPHELPHVNRRGWGWNSPDDEAEFLVDQRPPVPFPAPDGLHWEATPRDDWRFVTGKRCRRQGKGHKTCTNEAVAELNRGRIASYVRSDLRTVDSWWAYCADHMYGNWIEDGQVWRWKLVRNDD